jgi:RNA polymerase sigma-70 factor, ECF subfamily
MVERMGEAPASIEAGEPGGRRESLRRRLADAYDACAAGLYRYAAMLLADRLAAEDAVHQAFAKLLARGGDLREIEAVAAYLRSAVRNECYRMLAQRQRRRESADSANVLEAAAANESPPSAELHQALERAMRDLPVEQREIVHMKVYEQMTFQQIADQLAISINTAASRYRYALQRLRELLGPLGEELR